MYRYMYIYVYILEQTACPLLYPRTHRVRQKMRG